MARELSPRFAIAPHAARKLVRLHLGIGVAAAILALVMILTLGFSAPLDLPMTALMVVTSAFFLGLGLYNRSLGSAVQVLNKSFNAASFGQIRDAVELLDYAEETYRIGYVRRIIDLQRTIIAMRLGDLPTARRRADAAVDRPVAFLTRNQERVQVVAAHGLRALLRAASGERDGARADIEAVRRSPNAVPESLARAELAEALVLEREGDMEALRAHLTKERRLLLEHTHPRERAIVRGYQRMLKAKSTTVYRTSAPRAPAGSEEPALADWAAHFSPGVAPFVRAPAPIAGEAKVLRSADADPFDEKAMVSAERRAKANTGRRSSLAVRAVLLWGALIGMMFAVWELLAPTPGREVLEDAPGPTSEARFAVLVLGLPALFVIGATILVTRRVLRARRDSRRILATLVAVARGDDERAVKDLRALGASPAFVVGAQAHLSLAQIAERSGDLPAALAACEAGLGRLGNETARMVAADILLPSLLAERAFLFAAMDRGDDARAEIALIAAKYPSYPYLDKARFRVALVQRMRQGDIAGAAKLAEQSADLPLGPRDELLADLARAADRPDAAGAGEMERLREELRVDVDARRWLEVVAPPAMTAFSRAGERGKDAGLDTKAGAEVAAAAEADANADADADAQAEAEAAAEAEAEADAGTRKAAALAAR